MAAAAVAAISSVTSPEFLPFYNDFLESGNNFREINSSIVKDTNALEAIEASVASRYSQYNNDISYMYQLWEEHKDKIEKYSRAGILLRVREINQRYLNLRQELAEIASSPYISHEERTLAQNALLLSTSEPIELTWEYDHDIYSSDEEEEDYDSDEEEEEEGDEYDENNHPQEDEAHQPQENNNPHGELDEDEAGPEDNEEEDEYYKENINEDEIYLEEDDEDDY